MKFSAICFSVGIALLAQTCFANDGVYTGKALGRNGDVIVEVTVKDNKIAHVEVVDWSETHPVADVPKVKIPKDIVDYQSTSINAVSGASLTSFAIAAAVKDALKQAGLDVKQFNKKIPKPQQLTGVEVLQTGLVVIGGGGAGLSAAVAAAQNGVPVILIEKTHFAGGNTSVAGGCFNAADPEIEGKQQITSGRRKIIDDIVNGEVRNELQGELINKVKEQLAAYDKTGSTYLFDSPELHALQTWKSGDYKAKLPLVYKLAKEAPEMQKQLASMGFQWKDHTQQAVGALWPRSNYAKNYKSGVGYIDTFLDEIKTKNLPITFLYDTAAKDLLMQNGRVIGVLAKGANGIDYNIYGKDGVVLATGGFGANVEMRQKYDEIWNKTIGNNIMTTNLPAIQGDGIKMAENAGANLIQMGYIQLLPITDPYTGALNHYLASSTGMYVNVDGKRFVNELERRDVLSKAALAQPGQKFFIFATSDNARIDKDGRNIYGIKVSDILKAKKGFKADSWEELAEKAGINKENLVESVKKFNEFCKTLKDDEFGRQACDPDHRLDGPAPYYASVLTPSVHHTMGGIEINENAQVLNKDGKVIPGLYAAGEVTGGIHGTNRVGCNAIPDALIYGRIAGLTAIGK